MHTRNEVDKGVGLGNARACKGFSRIPLWLAHETHNLQSFIIITYALKYSIQFGECRKQWRKNSIQNKNVYTQHEVFVSVPYFNSHADIQLTLCNCKKKENLKMVQIWCVKEREVIFLLFFFVVVAVVHCLKQRKNITINTCLVVVLFDYIFFLMTVLSLLSRAEVVWMRPEPNKVLN